MGKTMQKLCKHLAAALAAPCIIAQPLAAAIPAAWTNSPGMPPYPLPPYPHGVPVDFAVTLRGYSDPPAAPGADVRLWFQTNGMGREWWSAPATLEGDVIKASFTPDCDTGADRVSLFFGAPSNVFASAVLRLTHSPGFVPNALPLPVRALDFGAVELRNLHALTNGWHFGGGQPLPWAELKVLRDGGKLVPGRRYRITDYETKCNGSAPAATLSENGNVWLEAGAAAVAADVGLAALPFDVIVEATSDGTLSETAQAAPRKGHVYASAVNFGAWKLMYCLDNDAARFSWIEGAADAKGVVYRLVDEHGNDCGYDFKNIVFKGRGFTADPADLIHRWSFNGSLEDTGSIGGMTATLGGTAALYGESFVRVNAGGNDASYVELGANPIPSDLGDTPFTIEVWATPTEIRNYASVFALGARSDTSAKGLMGVFHGYRQIPHADSGAGGWGGPVWQAVGGKINGSAEQNVGMTMDGLSVGKPYYFVYVVTPNGDGSATVAGYVYDVSRRYGILVDKSGTYTVTEWTTAQLVQSTFNLGTTPWNNNSPGADYDEVRVWKKALTPDQIEANVVAGPDRLGSGFRYTFTHGTGNAVSDGSLGGSASGNAVGVFENGGVRYLNRVVFSGSTVAGNVLGPGCASVFVAGGSPLYNSFGPGCACVALGAGCQYNSFGPRTRSCSFADSTLRSRTAAGCFGLKTGRNCRFGFGDNCGDVVLGDNCQAVTLGDGCQRVQMGGYCVNVMIGNGCQDVVFGPAGGGVQSYFRGISFTPMTRKVRLFYPGVRGNGAYVQYVDVFGTARTEWVDAPVPAYSQPYRISFKPSGSEEQTF